MRRNSIYLSLLVITAITLNSAPVANSLSNSSIEKMVSTFNKSIKGNIQADIYFNNREFLVREKIIKFGSETLKTFMLDENFDSKYEKQSTVYSKGKNFLLSSSSLQKYNQRAGLDLTLDLFSGENSFYGPILGMDYFSGFFSKDYSINLTDYRLLKSTKNISTYQNKDGKHNLDLLIRNNNIYALDYYTLDSGSHNSFLVFQFKKNTLRVKAPSLQYYSEETISSDLKNYINNYNLIREVGLKMVTSYLAVLASTYINKPGSDMVILFNDLFASLPESYKLYNPKTVEIAPDNRGISFSLSNYEVCGFLELDSDKKITSQKLFLDSTCS